MGPDGPDAQAATRLNASALTAIRAILRLGAAPAPLDDPAALMSRPPNPPHSDARDPRDASPSSPSLEAGLYVVSTPIGNLRDISLRALDVLARADLILAEDTRVTRKLLTAHGISTRLERCDEHSAAAMIPRVLADLAAGRRLALVSDAGTPLISDPGDRLVRAVVDAGGRVIPVPGASALLAALVASGLAGGAFTFGGFVPTKAGARRAFLESFADAPGALVLFETGPRLADSLAGMAAVLGDRPAAVARELTKMFEQVTRGQLPALAAAAALADAPRGEIVVVIGPPPPPAAAAEAEIDAALRAALVDRPLSAAVQTVADALRAPRRMVYARALALRDAGEGTDETVDDS